MNNLLRTLAASKTNDPELKLLLATVKETRLRNHDSNSKTSLSDPFYESLEGLLNDLRAITIDNRDAEPFQRPVLKVEAPDYYDIIQHPMDFQTMMKKVKSKSYKSKREFKDDLDLIWSNCFTYNASETHPLRHCARRLQAKAEVLLRNITDFKERTEPPIPPSLATTVKPIINGIGHAHLVNGYSRGSSSGVGKIVLKPPTLSTHSSSSSVAPGTSRKVAASGKDKGKKKAAGTDFAETPAILRTRDGMSTFAELERRTMKVREVKLEGEEAGEKLEDVVSALKAYVPAQPPFSPDDDDSEIDSPLASMHDSAVAGQKRKLGDSLNHRPRKRSRTSASAQNINANLAPEDEITHLWWAAAQSNSLIGNALPDVPVSCSSNHAGPHPQIKPRFLKRKRRKTDEGVGEGEDGKRDGKKGSLLEMMNANIRTMKKIRSTHAKFAALVDSAEDAAAEPAGSSVQEADETAALEDAIESRKWRLRGHGKRAGIEMGQENADDCLNWTSMKVLEHAGFQGSSREALNVITSMASEYLENVGRTLTFLTEKHGRSKAMSPEELILHTLFESGCNGVHDLETYIMDDIDRYGLRLSALEEKLTKGYSSTIETAGDDDGLFKFEDEEDEDLAMLGDFAEVLGEDSLGLRELGIAQELGMSNLTIPKKLLRGKRGLGKNDSDLAKSKEPPPPYPPPPPFIPLDSTKVGDQIGLLKSFYQGRVTALLSAAIVQQPPPPLAPNPPIGFPPLPSGPSIPALTGPSLPTLSGPKLPVAPAQAQMSTPTPTTPIQTPPIPTAVPAAPVHQSDAIVVLPDDSPSSSRVKMGPLGQIITPKPAATTATKKAKEKDKPKPVNGNVNGSGPDKKPTVNDAGSSKKKKPEGGAPKPPLPPAAKANPGGGPGSAQSVPPHLPPVVAAHPQQGTNGFL